MCWVIAAVVPAAAAVAQPDQPQQCNSSSRAVSLGGQGLSSRDYHPRKAADITGLGLGRTCAGWQQQQQQRSRPNQQQQLQGQQEDSIMQGLGWVAAAAAAQLSAAVAKPMEPQQSKMQQPRCPHCRHNSSSVAEERLQASGSRYSSSKIERLPGAAVS